MALHVLNLTACEPDNALLRGRLGVDAERVAEVLDALREICPAISPAAEDLREAARVVQQHDVRSYDAAYAAVARRRIAEVVTLDRELLRAGLGRHPSELAAERP